MRYFSRSIPFPFVRWCAAIAARCNGISDEAGSALVELGFVLSLLGVPLILGCSYFGTLLLDSIEIENAAHAGAQYGMQSSTFAENTSGIVTAAQQDSSTFGTNLAVASSIYYACSSAINGTTYSTQAGATTACTGGTNHALEFIQVKTSATVTPAATFPGLSRSRTVGATTVMQVEE